jgi:cobalt-zinc-cadmium efflux system membrane fusion protein
MNPPARNVIILSSGACLASLWACSRGDTDPQAAADQGAIAAGHGDEAGHDHGAPDHGAGVVYLEPGEIREFGLEIAEAGPGEIRLEVVLPGEVMVNPDTLVHITPRVPGVVREVHKGLGDEVRAGELLAVLDSRELAEAKADFLAARQRLELAGSNLQREQTLYDKQISSEQEYLVARQAEAEARIELDSAEQRLHALGLGEQEIGRLMEQVEQELTRFEMRAPLDGTVVEKHITLGEMLREESCFVISDLSQVWVVLTVYQRELGSIRAGQPVTIAASHDLAMGEGTIDYVSPILDEHTRTTTARVVLANEERRWWPGLFVTGRVGVDRVPAAVVVPGTAIQTIDGRPAVFVQTGGAFEPRPVELGRADPERIEVVAGLECGERYVARGGFVLKAQMTKASFEHAGHGH